MKISEAIEKFGDVVVHYRGIQPEEEGCFSMFVGMVPATDFFEIEELDLDINDPYFEGRVFIDTEHNQNYLGFLDGNTKQYSC